MPLTTKKTIDEIKTELRNRFSTLMDGLEARVKKDDPIGSTYKEY